MLCFVVCSAPFCCAAPLFANPFRCTSHVCSLRVHATCRTICWRGTHRDRACGRGAQERRGVLGILQKPENNLAKCLMETGLQGVTLLGPRTPVAVLEHFRDISNDFLPIGAGNSFMQLYSQVLRGAVNAACAIHWCAWCPGLIGLRGLGLTAWIPKQFGSSYR